MPTKPLSPAALHRWAIDLDGEAFQLRARGDREAAADANRTACKIREFADELEAVAPEMLSSRGLPQAFERERPIHQFLLALALVATAIALLGLGGMQ